MTVKDILKETLKMLNKSEYLSLNIFGGGTTPTSEQRAEINRLIDALNFAYREIATVYIPLLEEETVRFTDNRFMLANLSKTLTYIKSVQSPTGYYEVFDVYPTYVRANVEQAVITYAYIPDLLEIDDNIEMFSGKILPHILAYGVIREYYMIKQNLNEYDFWAEKFESGVLNACLKRKNISVRSRTWI